MNQAPGAVYEAVVDWGVTGLAGTLGLTVLDNQGGTTVARLTTSVAEIGTSGVYVRTGNVAPLARGQYTLLWDDGVIGPGHVATEELNVTFDAPGDPAPADPFTGAGPCTPWITGEDVEACDPPLEGVGSDPALLDAVAFMASNIMYELSGRLFPGECSRTVRPCRSGCGCFGNGRFATVAWYQTSADAPWFWRDECGDRCGCGGASYVKLAGIPVREILEVKVGGEIVDPSGYRLDDGYHLIRMADPGPPVVAHAWPACQNMALDDTEPGTFSISYTWGADPSELGKQAAVQLARQLWIVCNPAGAGECELPNNVSRIVRNGITIDKTEPLTEALLKSGTTGLRMIDLFMATVNPSGLTRRPAVWSPDIEQYGRRTA